MCAWCLLGVRRVSVCALFANGALREVSTRQRLPARQETTSHRVHTGSEVGEVVDKFEQTLRNVCAISRVQSLVCHSACAAHCACVTHLSDCVRLRDVSCTAQCVRGVCSVSVVSVCPFCGPGFARGLTAPATASTLSLRERPRYARRRVTGHTHTTSACSRTRIPSHLLSPGLRGNQGRDSKVCQSLPRRPLRQRFPAVPLADRTDQCPNWW